MDMKNLNIGKYIYGIHQGKGSCAYCYDFVLPSDSIRLSELIAGEGYNLINKYNLGKNIFQEYEKNGDYILTSYYTHSGELRIVSEPDCAYLKRSDTVKNAMVGSTVAQIDLEDFGLSYVIRLCDGRFIVIDGGWEFEPDADKLMDCLRRQSPYEKPVIAAWIMTHAHLDHYRCFFVFMQKYESDVVIESFIYNFYDINDKDPLLQAAFENESAELPHIARFEEIVANTDALVYKAHTGQVYDISNAHLEIISSPDDVFYTPMDEFNKSSLIVRMVIEGQTILWCGDAHFKSARLAKLWGDYLKSDILQVPHHGFIGGEPEEYDIINPDVCLWPVTEEDCYERINVYRANSQHLMYNVDVKESFTGGGGEVLLNLPYTPRPNGRKIYLNKIEKAQKAIGATSWFFDDVSAEDCTFTFISNCCMENGAIDVYADLYFEKSKNFVQNIKIVVPPCCVCKKNLLNPDDADPNALFFNRNSLYTKGVPEGEHFAVRFKSKQLFVVRGSKPDIYHN